MKIRGKATAPSASPSQDGNPIPLQQQLSFHLQAFFQPIDSTELVELATLRNGNSGSVLAEY
jgi:hypothetical protein